MVSRVFSKGLTKAAQALVGEIPPGMKKMPMSEAARKLMARKKPPAKKRTKPNADGAGIAFMKDKPPAGSGDQGKKRVLPRGDKGTGKLQQQFEALTKSAQRAEVSKGAKSKYASVLRKLGKLKDSKKAGGKIVYRKKPGQVLKGNQKNLDVNNDGKITKKDFDTINARPKSKPAIPDSTAYGKGATRGSEDAKMVSAKKMGGGQVMKYKKGGMVYKKHGGVVKAASGGDELVASCYTNKSIA